METKKHSLFNFKLAVAISLCLTMMVIPSTNSYGDRLIEQYGNKVTVSAELTRVKINYKAGFSSFNDPVGIGTGEVAVLYSFSEPGHSNKLETELNLSNWDLQWHDAVPHNRPSTGRESINKAFSDHTKYVHIECHPTGTLNAVFTVYNVNGRWPNWEGILTDTAKAAGLATLRQLAIQAGYIAAEGATMGGLFVAAVASVAIQNIIYTIRGNESLGVGTLEIDLQELGENGEQTYTVTTAETQFGNAEIEFKVRTNTEEIACSDVASSQTGVHVGDELYAMLDNDLTRQEIPGWIKQNAAWWSDGTITDADFAGGIGFLVKEGVIAANVKADRDGTILINENLSIPGWIKQNAAWWADGTISDSDFTSGIEYMVNQQIITFSEKPASASVVADQDTQDYFIDAFEASKWNEAALATIEVVNNAERDILEDLAADAWEEYDDSEDQAMMDRAKSLESLMRGSDSNKEQIDNFEGLAKKSSSQLKEIAKAQGVKSSELAKIEKEVQKKIDKPIKVTTTDQLKAGLAETKKLNKEATFAPGKNPLDSLSKPGVDDKELSLILREFSGETAQVLSESDLGSAATMEDKIMNVLLKLTEKMDKDIAEKAKKIENLNEAKTAGSEKSIDVETMQLKRLVDKRGQLFDIFRQIMDKYNETARGAIQSLRDGGSAETKTESQVGSEPKTETQPQGRTVTVLQIGGKYYPALQFKSAHPDQCESFHYHGLYTLVSSTDGFLNEDPNPSGCGFGPVDTIPVKEVFMTQDQINSFKNAMGFEP